MAFGYLLLVMLGYMIRGIALGEVRQETSYGLAPLLVIVTFVADRWSMWAFPKREKETLAEGEKVEDGRSSTGGTHGS